MTTADPLVAHRAVQDAEQRVADAQAELADAKHALDAALAAVGGRRLVGVFSSNDVAPYTNRAAR